MDVRDLCANAFLAGYERHAEHLTASAAEALSDLAGLVEALGDILEPSGLFETIEAEGERHGLWTQLYLRQDKLILEHDRKARDWAEDFARTLPIERLAHALVDPLRNTQEGGVSNQTRQRRRILTAAALSWLWHHLSQNSDAQQALEGLTVYAMSAAAAEGTASAAAELTTAAGYELPDLDALKADNLANLLKYRAFWGQASSLLQDQITALAGDLALHVGSLIASGASFSDIEDAVGKVLRRGDGIAFWVAHGVQGAYSEARRAYMVQHGVTAFQWITAGDDRVCAICEALEASGPYSADEAPHPPDHPGCRCMLVPATE